MGIVDHGKVALNRVTDWTTPQRVVFHHVPKCGGTSVGRALRRRYILSQATVKPEESFRAFEAFTGRCDRQNMLSDVASLREQMMLYLLYDDVRCVSLHVRFSEVAHARFKDRYKFVTILRAPEERFISNYFWSFGKTGAHGCIDEDFDTFLDTERARRLGATYSEFYSGLPISSDFASDEAVARAVKNLDKFDVVGRLDDLPEFEERLKATLGVRIRVGYENKMNVGNSEARQSLTPEQMSRVEELCRPDLAVWEHVAGRR